MNKLGNVNAVHVATLYEGKKIVGYCGDTPNQVAYGMKKTGAKLAKSAYGEFKALATGKKEGCTFDKNGKITSGLSAERIENGGWMKPEDVFFKSVG